jgi:hypothetical protein
MKRGNCLWFALGQVWKYGGYLIIRRSHHGLFPHFLWCPEGGLGDGRLEQFTPAVPNHHMFLPPPWYAGYVKKGADFPCAVAGIRYIFVAAASRLDLSNTNL